MKTYIKTLLFAILLLSSIPIKAETGSYSNPEIELSPADPNGDPGAPIDGYLLPMLAIGVFLGGYLSYKKQKINY